MQNQFTSVIKVTINSPEILSGMPDDTLQLHVVITNQGYKDARIYAYLDEAFHQLIPSNDQLQECLSLASQKSYEISFEFQIPSNTPPGTYPYRLIIDAPEDYPQETPIIFPLTIQVLIKEQTVRRGGDEPTFTIKPATNPNNHLIYKPGQPLLLTVTVNNRCQRVDRFRLSCPDLAQTWFTIRYPKTGYEGSGLLVEENGLELNNYSQGEIFLEIHPDADAFAGVYLPTIQLHSQNSPELILLDLVYFKIPETYILEINLDTILGKVSRVSGKYNLKIANQGNTERNLHLDAKTQDEEELCSYKFEPSKIKLLPNKSTDISLTVQPISRWKQPWVGSGLFLKFQIQIQDQQQLPVPDKLPEGTFIWKARPWWQFLLLLLLVLGICGISVFIIWRILHPEPVKIDSFESTSPSYQEGDNIILKWKLLHVKQIENLKLSSSFTDLEGNTEEKELKNYQIEELRKQCRTENDNLNCPNQPIQYAKQPGKYLFTLEAYNTRNQELTKQTTLRPIEIKLLPAPEVVNDSFKADKPAYEKGEQVNLSWQISNPEQLKKININVKQESGTSISVADFDFTKGIPQQLQKQCQKNHELTCQNVPVPTVASTPGKYTLLLQPTSKSPFQDTKNIKPSNPISIDVKPKKFEIEFLGINGNQDSTQLVDEGTKLTLSWKVKADPQDVTVTLSHSGKQVETSGNESIIAIPKEGIEVGISVEDKYSLQKPISRKITVITKPKSSPTPVIPSPPTSQPKATPTQPSNDVVPESSF